MQRITAKILRIRAKYVHKKLKVINGDQHFSSCCLMMGVAFSSASEVAVAVYSVAESAGLALQHDKQANKHSQHNRKGFKTHSKISNTNAIMKGV